MNWSRHTIQSVSIPRSGHRLLYLLLKNYFGDEFTRCEYYTCCKKVPCKKGAVYQKNHDLKLKLVNSPEIFHLVQYRRNIQEQLNAYFRFEYFPESRFFFESAEKRREFSINNIKNLNKVKNRYYRFVKKKLPYVEGFIKKWVIDNPNDNRYLLEYSDFVKDPKHHLRRIVEIISGSSLVDEQKISEIIYNAEISYRHNIKEDPLYTVDFNHMFSIEDVKL